MQGDPHLEQRLREVERKLRDITSLVILIASIAAGTIAAVSIEYPSIRQHNSLSAGVAFGATTFIVGSLLHWLTK
jgi:putative exporter of polyketide antibiotics